MNYLTKDGQFITDNVAYMLMILKCVTVWHDVHFTIVKPIALNAYMNIWFEENTEKASNHDI